MKNRQAIMIIYICMKIIDIFLGPFLVAYFIEKGHLRCEKFHSYICFYFFSCHCYNY